MNKRFYLLSTLATSLLFSGCMGYQLNSSTPAGINTIALSPIINRTTEPAVEIQVTHAMREQIQFDGRMKFATNEKHADATIAITLTQYELNPIAYDSDQRTTPNLYRLRITGEAELRNTVTGEVISTSTNYGEATMNYDGDLTSAKRDALPKAAAEIAKLMLDDLIDTWN